MVTLLSVRRECKGGAPLPQVEASRDLHGAPRLTILIHGYNNDECDAWSSYAKFTGLSDVGDPRVVAAFGEVCEFFWPGDSRILGGGSYPFEISRAIDAAGKLYLYLKDLARARPTPLEVQLVCHSLGNRLALEILKKYIADGRPTSVRFARTLMMAAAVKVSMIEDDRKLEPAAREAGVSRVLYSKDDPVLHWAFPTGEFLAGEGFGTAVGRFGQPESGTWGERAEMPKYGHGDYWWKEATGPQVKAWLGLAVARVLNNRTLQDAALPPPNTPDERQLLARAVGSTRPLCNCG